MPKDEGSTEVPEDDLIASLLLPGSWSFPLYKPLLPLAATVAVPLGLARVLTTPLPPAEIMYLSREISTLSSLARLISREFKQLLFSRDSNSVKNTPLL